MKTRHILIVCALLALSGCEKKKTFQGTSFKGKNYKVVFPSNWEVNEKGAMGSDLVALSPLEGAGDLFRENVNVGLENLPPSLTDQQYLALNLTNLNKVSGGSGNQQFTKQKVGNHPGYHLRYSLTLGQAQMDNDVYIVIVNKAAYIITCTNEKGNRDAFKQTMDAIIASFKIE